MLVASSRVDVAHYFVGPDQVESEIARLREARDAVAAEFIALQRDMPADAPPELSALLDVHLMLRMTSRSLEQPPNGFANVTTTPNGPSRRSSKCWHATLTKWRTSTCASARRTSNRSPNASLLR